MGVVTSLLLRGPVVADAVGGHMDGWRIWPMGFGWIVVVFAVLAIASIVRSEPRARSRSALDLLAERYARGEIDRDEFLTRRADLER